MPRRYRDDHDDDDDDPPDTLPAPPEPASPAATSVPTPSSARRIFRTLHDRYRKVVERLVLRRRYAKPRSVDDFVQEIFLQLGREVKKARLREPGAMITTLIGHEVTRRGRARKGVPVDVTVEHVTVASPRPDPARTAELRERIARFQVHLDAMSPADAEVILYIDVYEMTYEQVAARQSRSVTAVYNHHKRARAVLAGLLRAAGESDGPVSSTRAA
jgi:RNA polymerase sigma factor (sigma-70 family)